MAARQTRLVATIAVALALLALGARTRAQGTGVPARIVSLVPAVTEMLFEVGAGEQVVGVSRFDRYPARVQALARVGGLFDPDYERILRLTPDLVVTYGSQAELERRLGLANIRYYSYRHAGMTGLFRTMQDLGTATGHEAQAREAVARLRAQLDRVRASVSGRSRPRTLLVFGRERGSLRQVYAAGGTSFEQELLEIAGGVNVFANVRRESAQPSVEQLIASAPDVIVEMHGTQEPEAADMQNDYAVWARLTTVPAVRNGRVHVLYGDSLSIPGPRVGITAEILARAIHPDLAR